MNSKTDTATGIGGAISFLLIFGATLALHCNFLSPRLSNDDYGIRYSASTYPMQASSQGRPLAAIYVASLNFLQIDFFENQAIFHTLAFLVYSLGIFVFSRQLIKSSQIKARSCCMLIYCLIFLITFNLFSLDIYSYAFPSVLFALAAFFIFISLNFLAQKKYLKSFLALLLSVFIYQPWAAIFPGLSIIIKAKGREKLSVKALAAPFSIYFFALIVDYLYIKFLHGILLPNTWIDRRTSGNSFSLEGILNIAKLTWQSLRDTFGILPQYTWIIFFLILVFSFRTSGKARIGLMAVLATIFTATLPHLFTEKIDFSARSLIAVGSTPFIFLLATFIQNNTYLESSKLRKYLLTLILGINFSFLYFCYQHHAISQINVNKIDALETDLILNSIKNYEYKFNNKVTHLYIGADKHPTACYSEWSCLFFRRALFLHWSRLALAEPEDGGRKIYQISKKDYLRFFGKKNFKTLNLRTQLKFEENRAFLAVF